MAMIGPGPSIFKFQGGATTPTPTAGQPMGLLLLLTLAT